MKNSIRRVGNAVIEIPSAVREQLIAHARAGLPHEACGLLAGPSGSVERFYPMRNADESHLTYRLDPKDQIRVFEEIERKGWDLVGIFHSHTHTQAYPSETDRRQAYYPEAHYLLVSLADAANPALRSFRIQDGAVAEEEVRIT
jgi:proteasome lid subunit RPN8/RPN11